MSITIAIIGAGFAGLAAAKRLRKLNQAVNIELIAPEPVFNYLPSLIWVPSGKRMASDIQVPLQSFFKKSRINFQQGNVSKISQYGREVHCGEQVFSNDGLIIASGGQFIKKLPGIEHAITPCEGIKAVEKLKKRLEELETGVLAFGFSGNPNEPSAMRGGPVFEFLFGIDQLLRSQGRRQNFQLLFFSPAAKPGIRLGESAVSNLMKRMKMQNIQIVTGEKLSKFTSNSIVTEQREIAADLIVFMPGMTGNDWFSASDLPLSKGGLILSNKHCQVDGSTWQRTYVAGDAGSFPGPGWMPKQAHMAELQARAAARNLLMELDGKPAIEEFETELICLIDSENKGALVYRKGNKSLMLPPLRAGHWAKRVFEKMHISQYR